MQPSPCVGTLLNLARGALLGQRVGLGGQLLDLAAGLQLLLCRQRGQLVVLLARLRLCLGRCRRQLTQARLPGVHIALPVRLPPVPPQDRSLSIFSPKYNRFH